MDFDLYFRFALALVLVLGLIALLAWMMRRFGSMRVVVVAHALANTVALAVAYVFAQVG